MHRRLILILLPALALSSCAAETPAASTPGETVTITPTPTPSATSDEGQAPFLRDVRMKARTLTSELVDDETLVSLGEAACGPNDGQVHRLNATLNQGFTAAEVDVVFAAGKRHLC